MALPFMAALIAGTGAVMQYKREAAEQARIDEDRTFLKSQRERTLRLQGDEDQYQNSLKAAGAERKTEDYTATAPVNDDEGNAMPDGGTPVAMFKSGGRSFATQAEADATTAAENAPGAASKRITAVMRGAGKFIDAQQLEASDRQARLAEVQSNEAEELARHRAFARSAVDAVGRGGWQGAEKFATEQYNDGFIYKAERNDKGGATMRRFDKEGNPAGEEVFESPSHFLARSLARADPAKWIDYERARADRADDIAHRDRTFERDTKHQEGTLKIAQQNANTTEQHRKDQAAHMARTEARLSAAATKGAPEGLSMKDLQPGFKSIADTISGDYKAAIEMAADDKARTEIMAKRDAETAQVQGMYRLAMQTGIAVTTDQVRHVNRNGRTVRVSAPDRDTGVMRHFVGKRAGDIFVPISEVRALEAKPAVAPAAPTGAAVLKANGGAAAAARAGASRGRTEPGEPAAGPVLDAARASAVAARERFYSFGSRQRQVDPQGFRRAQSEFEATQAALREAEAVWQQQAANMLPRIPVRP